MPWAGIEVEQLGDATEEGESPTSRSPSEEGGLEGDVDEVVDEMQEDDDDGDAEQPSLKRRRIENPQLDIGNQSGRGHQVQENVAQQHHVNGNGNGQGYMQEQVPAVPGDDKVPFFKSPLADLDDKGENDCFFDSCVTRAGGNQYLMKHFRDKHGLIRGDQGRQEGGKRKAPKYLTLCPTNWPFTYNSSSSCHACGDISGLFAVLGQREHESPAICSFCWTYLPTRRDLVTHIDEGPCKSNEMFAGKLTLVRHMYAGTLRIPGADEISRAAAEQRQAHADAERAARSEKWQLEQQMQQQAQEHLRQLQAQQSQQQQQQQSQPQPRTPIHPEYHHPPPQQAPPPATQPPFSIHRFTPTAPPPILPPTPSPAPENPVPHTSAPPPPGTPHTGAGAGTVVSAAGVGAVGGVDYAVPAATAEAMARSIERLSGIVGDLTAANALLLQEVRVRDRRIEELGRERERLVGEVGRLGGKVGGSVGGGDGGVREGGGE
ncbi:hypothetical protein C8A01DRAFT_32480 [Parachaetomium inaequale]|uniref:Uncharacterized protein n=1 Tax=Parachaetomium inaequale TaxID=2588326 RepID=A0AAN6SUA0_9PEZI|nr:hypothetical protein C8A01DRAFT_32480 [Parachaetomium inaequale]